MFLLSFSAGKILHVPEKSVKIPDHRIRKAGGIRIPEDPEKAGGIRITGSGKAGQTGIPGSSFLFLIGCFRFFRPEIHDGQAVPAENVRRDRSAAFSAVGAVTEI